MKVLVCGDFAFEFYEPDFCAGLRAAGAAVVELPVLRFFGPGSLLRRAQTKLVLGPGVALANAALVAACAREKPDLVLLWRTPWADPLALWLARAAGAGKIALYTNDDPFGPDRDLRIWRALRRCIPHADLCLAYRPVNLDEYRAAGAQRVGLLRAAYNPRRHRPVALSPEERARLACDVIFVGHYEPDGREQALLALRAAGLRVRLHGTGWERAPALGAVSPAFGEDYVRALAGAKIGLCFLSQRNRDQVTRRCFEIPATGTLLLAPRTAELQQLFREDEEAAFFGSTDELVRAAERYCVDGGLRARIAAAGRAAVRGHDVQSRARELLAQV